MRVGAAISWKPKPSPILRCAVSRDSRSAFLRRPACRIRCRGGSCTRLRCDAVAAKAREGAGLYSFRSGNIRLAVRGVAGTKLGDPAAEERRRKLRIALQGEPVIGQRAPIVPHAQLDKA